MAPGDCFLPSATVQMCGWERSRIAKEHDRGSSQSPSRAFAHSSNKRHWPLRIWNATQAQCLLQYDAHNMGVAHF